ncbi:MAG: hypothetical protein KBD05_01315 [Candidatus Pacebacteria bacterium]|nr:hypothetical protein [Candidatus Paceibacterota bacterium]
MTILDAIRNGERGIIVAGNHPAIVQSMLDFDYLSGKERSVIGIVTGARKAQKYFWGQKEILVPCYKDFASVPNDNVRFLLNLQSGRRAFDVTVSFFETFPEALGAHLFAENVPEAHALELMRRFGGKKLIAGPSGVGILVPGHLKLGAIGGVDIPQITTSKLTTPGSVTVVATSGGMTSELIRAVTSAGKRLSFSLCIGGDRFPVSSLGDVLALAEADAQTKGIVYFGELGGVDEYEIVELIKAKKLTKPVVAYIAGIVDEAFDEHMQFGHAKALVAHKDESARAKREALREVGVVAPDTFPEFLEAMKSLPEEEFSDTIIDTQTLMDRQKSILSTREVMDLEEAPTFVSDGQLVKNDRTFASSALAALLGAPAKSPVTNAYAEAIFTLLIDHGGHVSGAVNTMVTARAGKDLVSSLASGLLTIGPRFGGAINEAARTWRAGVASGQVASDFVEASTKGGKVISGIGHRKYRVGLPDPRVAALSTFAELLKAHPHYDLAREVEKVTTGKNGSLILNVDGVIASLMLDILAECEGYDDKQIQELVDAEFFNALFVIPRSVGFIAHFMEQKENDEGLFRLPDDLLFERKPEK